VQNAADFYRVFANALDAYIRKPRENDLSRSRYPTHTTAIGRMLESADALINAERHAAGGLRAAARLNTIADASEIAHGGSVQLTRISRGTGYQ